MRCARCDYAIEARQESVTEAGVQYHAYCFEKVRAERGTAHHHTRAPGADHHVERGKEGDA
jgi:hypothetical protein